MGRVALYTGINLGLLYKYEITKRATLKKRAEHAKFIQSIHSAVHRYEKDHEDVLAKLKDVQRRIQYLTRGVPNGALDMRTFLDIEDGESTDQTRRFLCRRFYRELAQAFHPDKGGSIELFQSINDAYQNNDLDYLTIQYQVLVNEPKLSWRCAEGCQFWVDQELAISVRLRRLQSTELFKVIRLHITRQYEQASKQMGIFLNRKLMARKAELQFLIETLNGDSNGQESQGRTEEKQETCEGQQKVDLV